MELDPNLVINTAAGAGSVFAGLGLLRALRWVLAKVAPAIIDRVIAKKLHR